ncbi:hypothetical protein CHUAL_009948 [Chamberlinius hualienensis]
MKTLLVLTIFSLCISAFYCVPATFANLGSAASNIEAEILPCRIKSSDGACSLERNELSTFIIRFITPDAPVNTLNQTVYGKLLGGRIPFREVNGSACENLTPPSCPLQPNTAYTYEKSFMIKKNYPLIAVTVNYILKSEGDQEMVNLDVKTKITDKNVKNRRG